jgi:hypothetical protein
MDSFLVAPKSFLDALEKELIDSGLAEEEEEEEQGGASTRAWQGFARAAALALPARLLAR